MPDTPAAEAEPEASTYVEYSSNNSGGNWWLADSDWKNLEKAGWEVDWKKESWLGALATSAIRRGLSLKEAVREWASVTGQDPADEGCNCCGQPHNFVEYDADGKYLRSVRINRNNSWSAK